MLEIFNINNAVIFANFSFFEFILFLMPLFSLPVLISSFLLCMPFFVLSLKAIWLRFFILTDILDSYKFLGKWNLQMKFIGWILQSSSESDHYKKQAQKWYLPKRISITTTQVYFFHHSDFSSSWSNTLAAWWRTMQPII